MTKSSKNTPNTAEATAMPESMDERTMGQPLIMRRDSSRVNNCVDKAR